jgi:hypothetical protein
VTVDVTLIMPPFEKEGKGGFCKNYIDSIID